MFARFQTLCKDMNEHYSSEGVLPYDLQPGEYCAVQPAVGAGWQRAQVLERSDGVLQVCFVDTGATLEVNSSQSRELT